MQISKSEAARAWIMIGRGLVFVLIAGSAVYLAIQMVGTFGEGMGVDEASRAIYRRAHVVVHLFGTASSVAIGPFIRKRSKMLATLALLATILCDGYGIVNIIGFMTTNRLSVAEAKAASIAADWKKSENARRDLEKQIQWLEGQTVDATPNERRGMQREIDTKRKEQSAIQPPTPTAATVLADPQATWFSRMTSTSAENWQLALPVPMAFLLTAAEVLGFVFGVQLIAGGVDALRAPRGDDEDRSRGSPGGGGVPKVRNTGDVSKDTSNVSRTGAMPVGNFGRTASKRPPGQHLSKEMVKEITEEVDRFVMPAGRSAGRRRPGENHGKRITGLGGEHREINSRDAPRSRQA